MTKLIDILFVQFINLVAKIHKAPKDNPTRNSEIRFMIHDFDSNN